MRLTKLSMGCHQHRRFEWAWMIRVCVEKCFRFLSWYRCSHALFFLFARMGMKGSYKHKWSWCEVSTTYFFFSWLQGFEERENIILMISRTSDPLGTSLISRLHLVAYILLTWRDLARVFFESLPQVLAPFHESTSLLKFHVVVYDGPKRWLRLPILCHSWNSCSFWFIG